MEKKADQFRSALEYSYLFNFLEEDESVPTPVYTEFEFRVNESEKEFSLTCKKINSHFEIGIKIFEGLDRIGALITVGAFERIKWKDIMFKFKKTHFAARLKKLQRLKVMFPLLSGQKNYTAVIIKTFSAHHN